MYYFWMVGANLRNVPVHARQDADQGWFREGQHPAWRNPLKARTALRGGIAHDKSESGGENIK